MRTAVLWLVVLLLVVALAAGFLIGARNDPYSPEARANAARTAQEAADAARWRARWEPIGLALAGALGVLGLVGAGAAVVVAFRYLDRRARTVYPDRNGVMPAVVLRPGELVADLGALAGPVVAGKDGASYALPEAVVPQLQEAANRGAAVTRTMRAWATRDPGRQEAGGAPWTDLPEGRRYPPVEVLEGDEGHIYRLLEDGDAP